MSPAEIETPRALEVWLHEAGAHLSSASTARMREEIVEHYDAAYEDARSQGVGNEEAERRALTALGEAKHVNRRYREVMLTCSDARALRRQEMETRFVCARARKLWVLPVAAFGAAIWYLITGRTEAMWPTLLVAFGMAPVPGAGEHAGAFADLSRGPVGVAGGGFRVGVWSGVLVQRVAHAGVRLADRVVRMEAIFGAAEASCESVAQAAVPLIAA